MARFIPETKIKAGSLLRGVLPLLVLVLFLLAPIGADSASAGKKKVEYESDIVSTYFSPYKTSRKSMQKHTDLMRKINERNAAVEDSQKWISDAYKSIKLRKLNNIPKTEYANYKKYAGKGKRLYVIVHPAYYTFFGKGDMSEHPLRRDLEKLQDIFSEGGTLPENNLVERLYDKMAFDETLYVMQEQERLLRDFVEVYSTKKVLMLLILPRNYQKSLYGYNKGHDEFARYINEITNESDSVIYMDSVTVSNGALTYDDVDVLMEFIEANEIRTIVLGGGYVGRCLEGLYESILDPFGYDHIYMVPEITAVSPDDIQGRWGNNLITRSGRLNLVQLHRNLRTDGAYDKVRTIPKLKHFYMYRFLKAKLAREEGERVSADSYSNDSYNEDGYNKFSNDSGRDESENED
jgi:hypothetical protein